LLALNRFVDKLFCSNLPFKVIKVDANVSSLLFSKVIEFLFDDLIQSSLYVALVLHTLLGLLYPLVTAFLFCSFARAHLSLLPSLQFRSEDIQSFNANPS
jgi:hypothetical protein